MNSFVPCATCCVPGLVSDRTKANGPTGSVIPAKAGIQEPERGILEP